jgi:hypothetical protein
MKLNHLLFVLLFGLFVNHSLAQDSLKLEKLKYQLATQQLIHKAKLVTDPELKGLLAQQALTFANKYGFREEVWGDLHSLAYYSLKGLFQEQVYQQNKMVTRELAKFLADSAYNQYHGPQSYTKNQQNTTAVRSVVVTKDGKSMYSAGGDGKLLKWDIDSRSFEVVYQSKRLNRIVDLSGDERYLALATNENEMELFHFDNPKNGVIKVESHIGPVVDLVFLPDNSGFISMGLDRQLILSDFTHTSTLANITITATCMAISPNGQTVVIASRLGEIYIYDLTSDRPLGRKLLFGNAQNLGIEEVAFGPDGNLLAIGGSNNITGHGYITVWDMKNKKVLGPYISGFSSGITDIKFNPIGNLIAGASQDNTVKVFRIKEDGIFDLPLVLDDHQDWVWSVDFHPEKNQIFTTSADRIIRVFDLELSNFENRLCPLISRNLIDHEWKSFIGPLEKYPWEATCPISESN